MRKFIVLAVLMATCTAVSTGCDRFTKGGSLDDDISFKDAAMPAPAPMRARAGFTGAAMEAEVAGNSQGVIEQKLIRSAEIKIKVRCIVTASEEARQIVEGMGGIVTNTSAYEDDAGNKAMRVTLKVPSKKLDEALEKLAGLGEVKAEDVRTKDVTEQYVDLEARLSNAKRLERRLQTLLEDKKAKLEDVIKIEKELGRVREKIESMEARKRYFDSRVSMSTIEIVFYEPRGFGRGIFEPISGLFQRSLAAFTASIAVLIIVVSAAIPWAILFVIAGWLSLRLLRTWLRHKRAMKAKREKK